MNTLYSRLSVAAGILKDVRTAISNDVNDPGILASLDRAICLVEECGLEHERARRGERLWQAVALVLESLSHLASINELIKLLFSR